MFKENNKFNKIISILVIVISTLFIINYLSKNREVFETLKNIRLIDFILLTVLFVANLLLIALVNVVMIKRIDEKIPTIEIILLQFVNNFFNKIFSKGGAAYRGIYLKNRYQFPYSKFISTAGGVIIITIFANSIIGGICLLIIYYQQQLSNSLVSLVYGILLIGSLGAIILRPKITGEKRIPRIMNSIFSGWNEIKKRLIDVFVLMIISLINIGLVTTKFLVLYNSMGEQLRFVNAILYATLSGLTFFINITPGGFGINEAVYVFSSQVIGIPASIVLLGSIILRGIYFINSLLFGIFFYLYLEKKRNITTK